MKKTLIIALFVLLSANTLLVDLYFLNQKTNVVSETTSVLGYTSPNPPSVLYDGSGGAFTAPAGNPSVLGAATPVSTAWRDIPSNVTITGNLTTSGSITGAGNLTVAGVTYANGGLWIDGNAVIDDGPGWHRTYGATGWYNATYGGGWYMTDASWLRSYGGQGIYTTGEMQATTVRGNSTLCIGSDCRAAWPTPGSSYTDAQVKAWVLANVCFQAVTRAGSSPSKYYGIGRNIRDGYSSNTAADGSRAEGGDVTGAAVMMWIGNGDSICSNDGVLTGGGTVGGNW